MRSRTLLGELATSDVPCPSCGGPAKYNGAASDGWGAVYCRRCDQVFEDLELEPLQAARNAMDATLTPEERGFISQYRSAVVAVAQGLARGERVGTSVGVWFVTTAGPVTGRNPQTGEPLTVSGRTYLSMSPSHAVRAALPEPRLPIERLDAELSSEDPVVVATADGEFVMSIGGRRVPSATVEVDTSAWLDLILEAVRDGALRVALHPLGTLHVMQGSEEGGWVAGFEIAGAIQWHFLEGQADALPDYVATEMGG